MRGLAKDQLDSSLVSLLVIHKIILTIYMQLFLPHSFPHTADLERRGSSVTGGGGSTGSPVPFDLSSLSSSLPVRKTPESFLGPNAALVDLDSLVSSKPKPKQPPPPIISSTSHNPFLQTQGVYLKQPTFRDKSCFVYPANISFLL